jgi:hypothetical protein
MIEYTRVHAPPFPQSLNDISGWIDWARTRYAAPRECHISADRQLSGLFYWAGPVSHLVIVCFSYSLVMTEKLKSYGMWMWMWRWMWIFLAVDSNCSYYYYVAKEMGSTGWVELNSILK